MLLLFAEAAISSEASAQAGRPWRRDEQTLVTNFAELTSVAVGPRHVYAVSPAGVIAYDFTFERWEAPVTVASGFPANTRPTALAYDPLGGVLWLGTETGELHSYSPGIDRWERMTTIGVAAILEIIPYPTEGVLYLSTERGWSRLRTGSFIADAISGADVPAAVQAAARARGSGADPFLEAGRATIGLDPALRRWRLTDTAPAERAGEFWIATHGGGLARYDSRATRSQWLPYGLLSYGAGAIAFDGDRIWFGGDGRGPRNGVVAADASLQRWAQHESGYDGAPGGTVMDIAPTVSAVWFAASDGLFRLDRADAGQGRRAWRRITSRNGLPSDAATSVVVANGNVWVATTRGVIRLTEAGTAASSVLLPGTRINRLALARDTLWIAGDEGLFIVPRAGTLAAPTDSTATLQVEPAPGTSETPELRSRILDVAAAEDAIYVVREDAYFRYAAGTWSPPMRAPAIARIGRLGRAAVRDGALWLGGERGAARLDISAGGWTYFVSPADLPPGPIRAIVPAGDDVWVSNAAGAFRFRWAR